MLQRRVRATLLGVVGLLYVVSVPWYRSAGDAPRIILGLPDWVAVALACYVLAALLTAVAWLLTRVEDDDAAEDGVLKRAEDDDAVADGDGR